ncbi:endonuclease/exonuclease/phosphatase family protein [Smaragdicoccus niigatensis]|uniref:endonuclease/exonuclease/phosphatase family protein n=1 Tax=Smaragdicoccus niigatensis TaxID=359359 RepID=UPI0003A7964C|nr:endonuclease/exonuclease/phosphatase family protein [Smaragdicoccus niigatensis]
MHRVLHCAVVAGMTAAVCATVTAQAAPTPPSITVMTRNLYLGADLTPLATALTTADQAQRAADVFRQVQATDFGARAKLLAAEIAAAGPDLVGLQEVALWRTGDVGVLDGTRTPATHVAYDFLGLLQTELAALSQNYEVAVTEQGFDAEVSTALGYDVRFTTGDAILVKRGSVTINKRSKGLFKTFLTIPTVSGPMLDRRGWTAVDATKNGRMFRFINTHLDSTLGPIRVSQATELTTGPAATWQRVVLVGDLNATPNEILFPAYKVLIGAGFRDAWTATHGTEPGFTCCNASDLMGPNTFTQRIDHVLSRPALPATNTYRTGIDPSERTPAGEWPSDHAGVVATFRL